MDKAKAERARNVSNKRFHVLGSTDAVNTCDCCGKTGLKATWQIEMIDTGERFFYGSVCVTHNTARKIGDLKKMQAAHDNEKRKAANDEYSATPERKAYCDKINKARELNVMPGRAFADFCCAEREAADKVAREIAARHEIPIHWLI